MPRPAPPQLPTVTGARAAPLVELRPEHQAALREAVSHAKSRNTARAYRSLTKHLSAWLAQHRYPPPPWDVPPDQRRPVPPRLVAAWIKARADAGASKSTLSVSIAAISYGHLVAGVRFDRQDPVLKEAVAGARRDILRTERQAAPLRGPVLAALLDELPPTLHGARDGCILAMLYSFALRRSELAGLDWMTHGDGTGVLSATADALDVILLRSKTSQDGAARVSIPLADMPRAARAIATWIDMAQIEPGTPLLRNFVRGRGRGARLSDASVNRLLQAAVRKHGPRVGLTPAEIAAFSGHSGRVGFIVSAKEAGAEDSDVATTTRHKSLEMVRHYGQQADQRRRGAHKLTGVGV